MNNRTSVWWFVFQSTAIVVSILLAFAIEAWWSERQESEDEERLLQALKKEALENLQSIEDNKRYRSAVSKVCEQILATEPTKIGREELDNMLADLMWWLKPSIATGALTSFVEGGKLSLVDDPELSLQISRMSDYLDLYQDIMEEDDRRMRDQMIPFLLRNASFTQIANAASKRGAPGGVNWPAAQPIFDSGEEDHRDLLVNDEFRGLVVLKQWDQKDALNALELLELMIKQLIRLIENR